MVGVGRGVEAERRQPARAPGRAGCWAAGSRRRSWRGGVPRVAGRPPRRSARASWKRCSWRSLAGCSGSSLHAKCDQTPVIRARPARSCSAARATRAGQSSRAEPPRESPVSTLSWTRGPWSPARGHDLVQAFDGVRRDVDVGLDGAGERAVLRVGGEGEPAQQPAGVAGVAERERLGHGGDPEPGGSAVPGRAAGLDDPVAVAVGLDDRHQRGGGDEGGQRPDVVPDRGQVDHDLRAHGHVRAVSEEVAHDRGDRPRHVRRGQRPALRGVRRRGAVQPRAHATPRRTARARRPAAHR